MLTRFLKRLRDGLFPPPPEPALVSHSSLESAGTAALAEEAPPAAAVPPAAPAILKRPLPMELDRVRALTAFARRMAMAPRAEALALRGSFLLYVQQPGAARLPNDLDYVVVNPDAGESVIHAAAQNSSSDGYRFTIDSSGDLWNYSDAPGTRYSIAWRPRDHWRVAGQIVVDVANQETPLPATTASLTFPDESAALPVACFPDELALAWKLQWLAIDDFGADDLYDAWLLARGPLDGEKLAALFEEERATLALTWYRLLDETLLSNTYQREWGFVAAEQKLPLSATLAELAARLAGLLAGRCGIPRAEELPFIKSALASRDGAARLIYADWLEDRGDDRAELLRLDVKLRTDEAACTVADIARHAELAKTCETSWLNRLTSYQSAQAGQHLPWLK